MDVNFCIYMDVNFCNLIYTDVNIRQKLNNN